MSYALFMATLGKGSSLGEETDAKVSLSIGALKFPKPSASAAKLDYSRPLYIPFQGAFLSQESSPGN